LDLWIQIEIRIRIRIQEGKKAFAKKKIRNLWFEEFDVFSGELEAS
jgi:hypothetical protein